jgi:hypothetical protein
MADISYALTDDFITTVHSDDIYKEASVCEPIRIKRFDLTKRFQAAREPVSHGILLGMQCSKPRLVPILLSKCGKDKTNFAIWASMPKEIETLRTIVKAIDDAPKTIKYDNQQKAPEIYKNDLLSDSCLLWKGNVILLTEGRPWKSELFKEFSWLEEVKAMLLV